MTVREYQRSDRTACLAVFESNVGGSFLRTERPDFEGYLDALPGPYFVIEEGGVIIACGGYAANVESSDTADLCWGMVRRDLQGTGIGLRLVNARLERIRQDHAFTHVFLKTSHETAGFTNGSGS
ncbi:MAG: GNAT family N-acetyltransferase [Gemmatimonadota bacterium]